MDLIITYAIMAVVIYGAGRLAIFALCRRRPENMGRGTLALCPAKKENCVCSQSAEASRFFIAPFSPRAGESIEETFARLSAIIARDRRVRRCSPAGDYLHAEFVTVVWHFVDDFEALLDREAGVIHIRSASRLGHSDFGMNRRRVERLRQALDAGD